ncbi:MAG TPA: RT0821/Lpp0805 family surface protein [Steroidobacteraceae bacterium]|nr:RT0821/Lpp0805 family surface protein [Steroidobacteraceae bacterium]
MKIAGLAAIAVSAGAASLALAQSNLGYLRDAPSAKFTAQDFELLWAAVDDVSASRNAGTTKTWVNTATGSGGTIKLLGVFTSTDGRDCRRLRVDNYAKSLKGSSTQNVCAHKDGTWLLDADARPAPQ